MNHITAIEAREMAFNKVKTTYDDCLNRFMDAVFENIENSAKEGKLDIYMSLDKAVDIYFEGINNAFLLFFTIFYNFLLCCCTMFCC